jgi:uncharacterized membrane protein
MKHPSKLYRHIVYFSVGALAIAIGCAGFVVFKFVSAFDPAFPMSTQRADWGVLGDYFGGTLGPILNLVTVAMLVASFLFQHQQVKDARADADEAQQQAQNELRLLLKQSFEQTFFAWLKSYREYVAGITKWDGNREREVTGHTALLHVWRSHMDSNEAAQTAEKAKLADREAVEKCIQQLRKNLPFDHDLMCEVYKKAYEGLYKAQSSTVGTMLRTLYRLIKWVDESDLPAEEKYTYIAIVRAQLSMAELGYLMINGLTDRGANFRPFVNKYALLDNIEPHMFVRALSAVTPPVGYEPRAFKSELAKQQL